VPELDQHLVAAQLLLRPLEVFERGGLEDDVRRELHQDPAELVVQPQRLERVMEAAEDFGPKLARRTVDPAAPVERRLVAQVGWKLLDLHRMACHHAEGLHVDDEPVGRPLVPVSHHLLGGEAVVGRVRLHGVEPVGVVAQPLLGSLDLGRVEVLRQGLVGPRAGADADRRRHARDGTG
jgi:hypothetical protein